MLLNVCGGILRTPIPNVLQENYLQNFPHSNIEVWPESLHGLTKNCLYKRDYIVLSCCFKFYH